MSRFKIYLSVAALFCAFCGTIYGADAPVRSAAYEAYIERWKATALAQQAEYGIPASITLAQGLLESGAGQSDLATKANNHFGIKCHNDWQGKTYHKDDDQKNECFRSYPKAEDSFRDHSLFLKRKRYEVLFTYRVTDYKAWAKGLRECGYATDPKYPQKLIQIIETYELDKLGKSAKPSKQDKHSKQNKHEKQEKTVQQEQASRPVAPPPVAKPDKPAKAEKAGRADRSNKASKPKREKQPKQSKQQKPKQDKKQKPERQPKQDKEQKQGKQAAEENVVNTPVAAPTQPATDTVEWSPTHLRSSSPYAEHAYGKTNGRRFIVAQEGDTWGGIAFTAGMEAETLRRINEADAHSLRGGDKVYFFPKRRKADRSHTHHYVQAGQTAWDIAQYYGMRMSTLNKLNGLQEGEVLSEGQVLKLR